jgi:hypothetical protein
MIFFLKMTDQYNIENGVAELYINTDISIPESPVEFSDEIAKSLFSKTENIPSTEHKYSWSDIFASNSWRSFTDIFGWTVIPPEKHNITIMDVWRCWTDLFWFEPSKHICECISKVKSKYIL